MTFLHTLTELLVLVRQDTTVMEKQFNTGLQPEASWLTAIYKNLANQSLYNNAVKEILNGVLRNESLNITKLLCPLTRSQSFLENSMISFSDP